jgi:hypothetical protein
MSEARLNRVIRLGDRSLPVFAGVDRLMLEVSRRAHELFEARGAHHGSGRALRHGLLRVILPKLGAGPAVAPLARAA